MTFRVALFGVGLLAAGCYPKAAPPPATISGGSVAWAAQKWPGATEASLSVGRDAFLAKCNGCHGYPDLKSIEDERWPAIVERMGGKADLDKQKTEAVLQYILASRHP